MRLMVLLRGSRVCIRDLGWFWMWERIFDRICMYCFLLCRNSISLRGLFLGFYWLCCCIYWLNCSLYGGMGSRIWCYDERNLGRFFIFCYECLRFFVLILCSYCFFIFVFLLFIMVDFFIRNWEISVLGVFLLLAIIIFSFVSNSYVRQKSLGWIYIIGFCGLFFLSEMTRVWALVVLWILAGYEFLRVLRFSVMKNIFFGFLFFLFLFWFLNIISLNFSFICRTPIK